MERFDTNEKTHIDYKEETDDHLNFLDERADKLAKNI